MPGDGTLIEWAEATWNVITGCSVTSPGCKHCYAMQLAGGRLRNHPSRRGLTHRTPAGPVWTGAVRFNREWLDQPVLWRRSRVIFVCAHGDLFHQAVPDEWIDQVYAVMAAAHWHTFIVLTKRSERMRLYWRDPQATAERTFAHRKATPAMQRVGWSWAADGMPYPLPNIWHGVSIEDQPRADQRVPDLLETPSAVRFVSAEPLLGPVEVLDWLTGPGYPGIDWVIAGGESGPGARPMLRSWARSIRDQCQAAGVAYFHKQNGEWIDADEWLDLIQAGPAQIMDSADKRWEPRRPLTFDAAESLARLSGRKGQSEHQSDGSTLIRVGKAAAGRLLDGREWSEMPAP